MFKYEDKHEIYGMPNIFLKFIVNVLSKQMLIQNGLELCLITLLNVC